MKTKQRILNTCLTLFNEEGEQHVSAVDIANELDISPGNLYYHFKGKEPIIETLFDEFESRYSELLSSASEIDISTESSWKFLYILLEEIYQFRFFYENVHNILERIPTLKKRFARLLNIQRSTMELVLLTLLDQEVVIMRPDDIATTAQSLSLTLTHWLSHNALSNSKKQREILLNTGAYQMVNAVGAFLAPSHRAVFDEARELLKQSLLH